MIEAWNLGDLGESIIFLWSLHQLRLTSKICPPMTDQTPIRIAIAGAAGRMGRQLCRLANATAGSTLTEAFDCPGHPEIGTAATTDSTVQVTDSFTGSCDVLIDFTTPAATRLLVSQCVEKKIPLVIGTTGLNDEDQRSFTAAGSIIPILHATNFSLVVNVLNLLSAQAAKLLGDEYDIEIVEAHHRHKKDAPSGTALTLAQHICNATGRSFEQDVITSRSGDDIPRNPREITVQALRLGDVIGEHSVMFAAPGERMELKHIGTSRDSYAVGAVRAAIFLADKPAGQYYMKDVLGLA